MPSLEFRYVGQDRLPARLSEFDVERYFALSDSDVAAINERFRRDRRAGAAIQLVFLRASGHTLDHVGTLRTLYQRYKTQYEHQVWACEYLGLTSMGTGQWAGLEAWMRQDAAESLTLDELVQHAHHWLYERRLLIPAERTLRDLGRAIRDDRARMTQDAAGTAQPVHHYRNSVEGPLPEVARRTLVGPECGTDRETARLCAAHTGPASRQGS